MTKLRCVGKYINMPRGLVFEVGVIFEADEAQAAYLLVDAPGCFEVVKAVTAPPANKMVKSPEADK